VAASLTTMAGCILNARSLSVKRKSPSVAVLADAVRERVRGIKPGPKPWLDRLPPDVQEQLLDVRRRFQSGDYGAASAREIGQLVAETAAERKWLVAGWKEISLWLRR
jgi:hypothetical protein